MVRPLIRALQRRLDLSVASQEKPREIPLKLGDKSASFHHRPKNEVII